MKTLYLDIVSGISGDMFLALLLGFEDLSHELSEIFTDMFNSDVTINIERAMVNGISCNRLVIREGITKRLRYYNTIKELIGDCSLLEEKIKKDALNVFKILAEAESRVHNIPFERVHFHEVGAVDTIIDVVGVSYLISKLNVDRVVASPVVVGKGIVKISHGLVPLPVPAVAEILKGCKIKRVDLDDELTTPTGASLYKYFIDETNEIFKGRIVKISNSTGSKTFESLPNILRGFILEEEEQVVNVYEMECNIDDMTGEQLAFLNNLLMEQGALDSFFTPIYMKKGRPAYKLTVLAEKLENVLQILMKHSTTAGVRYSLKKRVVTVRDFETVVVAGREVRVKKYLFDGDTKVKCEWEDIVNFAKERGISIIEAEREIYSVLKQL